MKDHVSPSIIAPPAQENRAPQEHKARENKAQGNNAPQEKRNQENKDPQENKAPQGNSAQEHKARGNNNQSNHKQGKRNRNSLAPSVVTMGEPAGIGPEITLKSWQCLRSSPQHAFFVIGDGEVYRRTARDLSLDIDIVTIDDPREASHVFAQALPVLNHGFSPIEFQPGSPHPDYQKDVIRSISEGVRIARSYDCPIITNPIHKASWHEAGFDYPGHTEWLGALCSAPRAVMMLANPKLRVTLVTTHIALEDIVAHLDMRSITETIDITAQALKRDFAIPQPRIAVAALNPHGGEQGHMGNQERTIITPAIAQAHKDDTIHVFGPCPADTLFHDAARADYDAVICMYHDQALIPLKTLDFRISVNITLGLDIVRLSPGHGTACDIVGQGKACCKSLSEAITQGQKIARQRHHHVFE